MRAADYTGESNWCAWKVSFPLQGPEDRGLGLWLFHCPRAHAFWEYWSLVLIDIRDRMGVLPAIKHQPEVTHEICILAISPDTFPNPDQLPWSFLQPPDLVCQFEVELDIQAIEICEEMVSNVMTGHISPDVDFASAWKGFIERKVSAFRKGLPGKPLL